MSDEKREVVLAKNADAVATAEVSDDKKPKSFTIGVGESDQTVLKNANIQNSSIGHIGEQIDVKDGGKVMTAEAVAAEAKLKQARAEDIKEKFSKTAKDALIPGHRFFSNVSNALDNASKCKKSSSRYDEAINSMLNRDAQIKSSDAEMSK